MNQNNLQGKRTYAVGSHTKTIESGLVTQKKDEAKQAGL